MNLAKFEDVTIPYELITRSGCRHPELIGSLYGRHLTFMMSTCKGKLYHKDDILLWVLSLR